MKITLLLGAPLDELVKSKEISLTFDQDQVTVRDLLERMLQCYGSFESYLPEISTDSIWNFLMLTRNDKVIRLETLLQDNDTIQIRLPLEGG